MISMLSRGKVGFAAEPDRPPRADEDAAVVAAEVHLRELHRQRAELARQLELAREAARQADLAEVEALARPSRRAEAAAAAAREAADRCSDLERRLLALERAIEVATGAADAAYGRAQRELTPRWAEYQEALGARARVLREALRAAEAAVYRAADERRAALADRPRLVRVEFLQSPAAIQLGHRTFPYNSGERAGFDAATTAYLVARGLARYA